LIHFFTKTVKQSNLLYTIKLAKSGFIMFGKTPGFPGAFAALPFLGHWKPSRSKPV
jgi:hypothetical protein